MTMYPLPGGPGRFIPRSDLDALRHSPLHALCVAAARYGGIFRYPVGFWTITVVTDPEGVQHILQTNNRNYSKETFQYQLLGLVTGQGLLLVGRRLLVPAAAARAARVSPGAAGECRTADDRRDDRDARPLERERDAG